VENDGSHDIEFPLQSTCPETCQRDRTSLKIG
jgi:hypothetical protein